RRQLFAVCSPRFQTRPDVSPFGGAVLDQKHPIFPQIQRWLLIQRALGFLLLEDGRKPERTALTRLALSADLAAHNFHQLFRDREAQAGAPVIPRARIVHLYETLEQA